LDLLTPSSPHIVSDREVQSTQKCKLADFTYETDAAQTFGIVKSDLSTDDSTATNFSSKRVPLTPQRIGG